MLGAGSTRWWHWRLTVLFLNDTELPGTSKIPARVVNILQGMSAIEDMDLAYALSAVHFDNNGLRYTTKNYRNSIVHLVSMQTLGSICVASIGFLDEEYWSSAGGGLTLRTGHAQCVPYCYCSPTLRKVILIMNWTLAEHSGAATPLMCSLFRTSCYTLQAFVYSTISYHEYRRRL